MLRRILRLFALFLILCLARAINVQAQDDVGSGLFTEARHLPLVAQSATLEATPGEARLHLVQVFFNEGDAVGQADYRLHLPQDAVVLGHGFWSEGVFLAAELKERQEAERAHAKAAAEGRSSTILKREGTVHAFSVFPVGAGEQVKVELDLLLPVERALGRSVLRVPVDSFLGQSPATTSLLGRIETEGELADWSVEGAEGIELERGERFVSLAFTTDRPVEIAWSEEGPALASSVQALPLPEGGLAIELRVLLNDAKGWSAPPEELVLIVDASQSMERRAAAVAAILQRLERISPAPVRVVWTAESQRAARPSDGVLVLTERQAGHAARWDELARAAESAGCDEPARRCAIVTDAQLEGLAEAGEDGPPLLVLADANELAHFGDSLPQRARTHQPGVEPEARLLSLADGLALASFELTAASQSGIPVAWPGRQELSVAEGGLLRIFGRVEGWNAVDLQAEIAGRALSRELELRVLEQGSEEARSLRRGYHRELLAEMFARWRKSPSEELKQEIVRLSLREEIPTAFTALQVDDPRLSMHAIKPGDPLLSVSAEPGVLDVVAWYPFGEMRRLSRDEDGQWHDRFLVPRDWSDGAYRIDVFKRHQDGRVTQSHAWYRLDDSAPSAALSHDEEKDLVVIDTGAATGEISSVIVHGSSEELVLSPAGNRWSVEASATRPRASVVVRDKAGNQSWFDLAWEDGRLVMAFEDEGEGVDGPETMLARRPRVVTPPLRAAGRGPLRREGERLVLELDGRTLELPAAALPWSSLELTAAARRGDRWLLGTASGEITELERVEGRWVPTTSRVAAHRISGIAPLPDERWLVGVLGRGLLEWRDGRLQGSSLRTGTRYVTSVLVHEGEVFVGTAYRGLWRLGKRGLVRTHFPRDHVASLESTPAGLEIVSGFGRYRRAGRDRFAPLAPLGPEVEQGSARLTCAAQFGGRTFLGSFDRGLLRLEGDETPGVDLGLRVLERQVDDLAVFGGRLWLATQGGLLAWSGREGDEPERFLEAPVHDLHADGRFLLAATKRGLYEYRAGEDAGPRRLDDQSTPTQSFFAVTRWQGRVWAGGMDGLYRFDADGPQQVGAGEGFRSGWVTALLPDGEGLLIGTYATGVFMLQEGSIVPAPGLEETWVPPGGLHRARGSVWIGGLGRPAQRWDEAGLSSLRLPAADVHAVAEGPGGGLLLLTSEGLLQTAD